MKIRTALLVMTVAMAQSSEFRRSPRDRTDIVQRVAASDLTIIGTAIKLDLARTRSIAAKYAAITPSTPPETMAALQQESDISMGFLYTIRVDSALCGANEFQSTTTKRATAPTEIQIFKTETEMRDGGSIHDPHPPEMLAPTGDIC